MPLDAEPVRQNESTPKTSQEADNQANQAKPNIPAAAGVLSAPPPKTHCEITCKNEKGFWETFKDGAEIFGIFLLFVYTLYTIKMYCANRDAANAATSAAKTAHNSLVSSLRPWLAIDGYPEVLEPVQVDSKSGVLAKVRFPIKNFGTSPALYVNIIAAVDAFVANGTMPLTQFEQASEIACQGADLGTHPIVPGQGGTGPYIVPGGVLRRPIEMRNPPIRDFTQPFRIIGCIAYLDQFKEMIHHTTFCFRSGTPIKDAGPNVTFDICPINQNAD